jgi:hypothetical protein
MSNIFQIGPHVFNVFESGGRWRVSVNGSLVDDSFFSRSDAWAAGLAEAHRLERSRSETVSGTTRLGPG